MSDSNNKPSAGFWIISVLALVWNAFGVASYLMNAYMTDEAFAALSVEEQSYHTNLPAWVTAFFAISVFSAFLACLGLLMRKKWANPLFVLSFLAVVVQFVYNFFIQDYVAIEGTNLYLTMAVLLISVFLVWFSKKSVTNGTLK